MAFRQGGGRARLVWTDGRAIPQGWRNALLIPTGLRPYPNGITSHSPGSRRRRAPWERELRRIRAPTGFQRGWTAAPGCNSVGVEVGRVRLPQGAPPYCDPGLWDIIPLG